MYISPIFFYFLGVFPGNCIREVFKLSYSSHTVCSLSLIFYNNFHYGRCLFCCIENPRDTCASRFGNCLYRGSISAVPKIQYTATVCSLTSSRNWSCKTGCLYHHTVLSKVIHWVFAWPFSFKGRQKLKYWRCYVRVFSLFYWMLPNNHRWVTLNDCGQGIYWSLKGLQFE